MFKNLKTSTKMTLFELLETCGYKLNNCNQDISYTTDGYKTMLNDIEEEGSGELDIYFSNQIVLNTFVSILRKFNRYFYCKDILVITLVIDENDIQSSTECEKNCKCINCEFERHETSCIHGCKCINCVNENI